MQQATRAANHPRAGGQRPHSRSRLPINGRVTRADLERLYAEFTRESRRAQRAGELNEPPTLAEYQRYLVNAIIDPDPPRSRLSAAGRRAIVEAQRRRRERERRARSTVACHTPEAAVAA